MADVTRKIERPVEANSVESTKTNADLRLQIRERTLAEDVLRQLSQHIVHAQDEERRRIARELHDSIGQYLRAIGMGVASLREWLLVSPAWASRVQLGGKFEIRSGSGTIIHVEIPLAGDVI